MAEQIYRYKAFISYRHVDPDRRWAKWLIDSLETYRTPRALVQRGVPSHIGHLFRDDEEIPASSNLSHQIEEALQQSQYLIVVCSPNTPKSQWCRHEIDYFRKLGKGDRILALLIEGEPSESFPPELVHVPYEVTNADGSKTIEMRDEEPIASDIRPREDEPKSVTERRALIRIAATLLGVAFDDLAQRDHQRAVRQQRIIGGAVAAAVLVVGALGLWYWDHTRVKTAYYADIGWHWGEPFGIGKLSQSDASHRWASYEVQSQRGHVIHVRRVNGSGGLRALRGNEIDSDPWNGDVADWVVRYEGDNVRTIVVSGATGKVLRTETYDFNPERTAGLVKFGQKSGELATLSSKITDFRTRVSAAGIVKRPNVMQHALTYTSDGYIARRVFQTVYASVAQDENGTAGRDYTYTADGQVATVRGLNVNQAPTVGNTGAAEERRSYTASGDLARFDLRDAQGAEVYAVTLTYDGNGNPVDRLWTGADGKPVLNADDKIAEERDAFDGRGNMIRARFFDEAGQPAPNAQRYAQYTNEYDALGRVTRTAYFNGTGAPVLSNKGVASATSVLDADGNLVGVHLFGLNGKPVIGSAGYATMLQRFGAARDPQEIRFFGTDGRLILGGDGVAVYRYVFDARGNQVDWSWYDTHDKLMNAEGYARQRNSYDERGNKITEDYYDVQGRRAINAANGLSGMRYQYTEHGDWSEISFIGIDGKPFARSDTNAARITFTYDARDNPIGELFFDAKGARVNSPAGFSSLQQVYNADDEVIEQHFYDANDQPVKTVFGYAGTRSRYDDHGNEIELTLLDVNGNPVDGAKGYATVRKKYDAYRREIEQRYFDAAGKPVLSTSGFAVLRSGYDRRGNKVEFATYDLNDKLVVTKPLGFARSLEVFDVRGLEVEASYFDAAGHLVLAPDGWARKTVAYDDFGNLTDLAYFDAAGKPVMYFSKTLGIAFARLHAIYRDGELVSTTYYSDKGLIGTLKPPPHRSK